MEFNTLDSTPFSIQKNEERSEEKIVANLHSASMKKYEFECVFICICQFCFLFSSAIDDVKSSRSLFDFQSIAKVSALHRLHILSVTHHFFFRLHFLCFCWAKERETAEKEEEEEKAIHNLYVYEHENRIIRTNCDLRRCVRTAFDKHKQDYNYIYITLRQIFFTVFVSLDSISICMHVHALGFV